MVFIGTGIALDTSSIIAPGCKDTPATGRTKSFQLLGESSQHETYKTF